MTVPLDRIGMEAAWAALRAADWAAAHDRFLEWLEHDPDDPEALDGLGRALWWLGQAREGVERRREAYVVYSRRGEKLAAANLATHLAAEHRIAGDAAAANGWLARAERLLERAVVFGAGLARGGAGEAFLGSAF